MLKFFFYFSILVLLTILILFITRNEGKTLKWGFLNKNTQDGTSWPNLWFPHPPNYHNDNDKTKTVNVAGEQSTKEDATDNSNSTDWPGLWFPHIPNYHNGNVKAQTVNVAGEQSTKEDATDNSNSTDWPGLWFPHPPNYHNDNVKAQTVNVAGEQFTKEDATDNSNWPGLWFPHPPNYNGHEIIKGSVVKFKENVNRLHDCDSGKYGLAIDFDPQDKRHSYNYVCLDKKSKYDPDLNTSALLKEYLIPAAFKPPLKCLNESIEYSETLPTFGAYRPLAPKFGSYRYLPPQRWLHSLADGAIVLLYHPCAFAGQIKELQNTVKGCLYRHVITPSQHLTPQRPLALLAWGKILQMSVVDDAIVVKFIKDNAKLGFRQKQQKLKLSPKLYEAGLLTEAHLVTDEQDKEICGYKTNEIK